MKRLLLILALALSPGVAHAAGAVYTGSLVVPVGSTITLTGTGSGCALINSSGIIYQGICPSGTAAFTGTSPIVITGSGPYAITCPTCFTTAGGTVTGSTTFSNPLTAQQGITSSSISAPVISGISGTASSGFEIGSAAGFTQLSATSTAVCGGITGNALTISSAGTAVIGIDTSGNLCSIGTIYYTSDKHDKWDIHSAHIDGLAALESTDFNLAWRYLPKYGNPNQVHYGPMANDLPSYISGPQHNRIDTQALSATEAVAILQLDHEVGWMKVVLVILIIVVGILSIAVYGLYREARS